jgi:hypothetical protein
MDLHFSDDDIAFRDTVRAFLAADLPPDLRAKVRAQRRLDKDDYVRWHRILARQGWAAPGWPREYGGPGWTPVQRHIFEDECALAGTPPVLPFGTGRRLRPRRADHERAARRRPLHRQRPEDLDHAGPACRHDLLPRAHGDRRAQAGGHFLPADRHAQSRRHRASHRHARRRP